MSKRIGEVNPTAGANADVHVWASRGGVELKSEIDFTLEPATARDYAALLVRAADEVERMRATPELP
jgi:hypothetical protein